MLAQNTRERLVNVHELALQFGVTESFIYKNIQRLKIPHVKLGRLVRFEPSKVLEWLQILEAKKKQLAASN